MCIIIDSLKVPSRLHFGQPAPGMQPFKQWFVIFNPPMRLISLTGVKKCLLLLTGIGCMAVMNRVTAQCTTAVSSYPFTEMFETSDGGWTTAGNSSTWVWGTPSKPVINAAGEGAKCWMAGGLTPGTGYGGGEQSWLQSPCFDFTNLPYPYITMKLFWETEQQWDGASFQYSLDNGTTWTTAGSAADKTDCLNQQWFNTSGIGGLNGLISPAPGWTGNKQLNNGSCRGGNGSKEWVVAGKTLPALGGQPAVLFRFVFGAGTTCNNFDGFAVDSLVIRNAPPNRADFTYTCALNRTVNFTSRPDGCPVNYRWEFDDPLTFSNNVSSLPNPSHTFSRPGHYTVTLTVDGPGNAPSSIALDIVVIDVEVAALKPADCETNNGGELEARVDGARLATINYLWNSVPAQQTPVAVNLPAGNYTVQVTGPDVCGTEATGVVDIAGTCRPLVFPTGFTPNADGLNDVFGPLGSTGAATGYRLRIYNRWGQEVFQSANPAEKWNGRTGGKIQDTGLYIWVCEYRLPGREKAVVNGTVTLIR